MGRALTLGNGSVLVNFDDRAQVRDFYFPYIGLENHIGSERVHRVGIWTDGELSWTDMAEWEISITTEEDSLIGITTAVHPRLAVQLEFQDAVYNEKNILIRQVRVHNLADRERQIKVFFGHQFEMSQAQMAHTAFYDPEQKVIVHYRNRRVFLVNAQIEGKSFDEYTTGVFGSEGKEGSHLDAADGKLSQNPIEHGRADSVLGLTEVYGPKQAKNVFYWLIAAKSIKEALAINAETLNRGLAHMLETTRNYWRAWIHRQNFTFYGLSPEVIRLFKRSLFLIRIHSNHNGGIIASCDYHSLQQGKDTYNYIWPRDAAYAALALCRAGDYSVAKNFFTFASQLVTDAGYFMHKYSPDGSLGSSWHPWMRNGRPELPIQEDETALVLASLWEYYEITKDLEFVEDVYNSFIKRMADFLVMYRDTETKLPKSTYDLWEEKYGTSTFTAAGVYGALIAAAKFAKLLGKIKSEDLYRQAALEVREGILHYLWSESDGYFYKLMRFGKEQMTFDTTVDISSVYGIYHFNVLPVSDNRVTRALKLTGDKLTNPLAAGGVARYEGDGYCRLPGLRYPGNPWFVTTLWFAQQYLSLAKTEKDLMPVKDILEWTVKHAKASGLLSEQLQPESGAQLSVSPLVWSHSEFVLTVIGYLDKLEELGICKACNPVY
jgi:GH15 family glucan-1,4-alpha-glucosidase